MKPFKTAFIPPVNFLETPRLLIRVDSEEAYIERLRTAPDAELMTWCGFATAEELAIQKLKIEGGFSNYRTSTVLFHLTLRDSGQVVGSISFHNWYQIHRRTELGYGMSSEGHKAQGLMREALPEVLRFGFEAMDLNRVEAFISPENEASKRMVARTGFRQEGHLRQHYAHADKLDDSLVYGLLLDEWLAKLNG